MPESCRVDNLPGVRFWNSRRVQEAFDPGRTGKKENEEDSTDGKGLQSKVELHLDAAACIKT